MKVFVVDGDGSEDPFVAEHLQEVTGCDWDTMLYMPLPRGTPISALDTFVKGLRSQWRRVAQAAVLRLHSPDAEALLASDRVTDSLCRRFEGRPILLAHPTPAGTISLTQLGSQDAAYDEAELLAAVRFAELRSFLRHPGVVLPPNDDFHYEGPNKQHYESFIRVGTAIQNVDVLDSLNFWLQPHVADRSIVLLDSGTIISLALNLDRYAHQSGFSRSPLTVIECQRSYNQGDALLHDRLSTLVESESEAPRALILSSVVSSGQLAANMVDLAQGAGIEDIDGIGIYGSESAPGEVLCRPPDLGQHWPGDSCPIKTPTLPVAPSNYLLELTLQPQRTAIRVPNASQAWEFFDRYRGKDCLLVHRDQHDRDRHHMIHVDAGRLARTDAFKPRLEQRLEDMPEIDVVLCPDHPAAIELANQVKNLLGTEIVVADETELRHPPLEDEEKLKASRRILVVDDVVITGTRIRGYRHFLRGCDYLSGDSPEIHLLVGVARTSDNTALQGIGDMVDVPDRFHPVENLLLPNWDHSDCPWCWEAQLLEKVASSLPQSDRLSERIQALEDTGHGLRSDLFLPWSQGGERLPIGTWELGPGSVFHADTQAEMFAAVASAIQSLRSAGDLRERPTYPIAYVFNPSHWLTGRYYDPAITAAILRGSRRHDLRTAYVDPELLKALEGRLREEASRELRGEILLAMGRGHLPAPPELTGENGALADPTADRAIVAMLRSAFGAS
jgi:hypothetical protein